MKKRWTERKMKRANKSNLRNKNEKEKRNDNLSSRRKCLCLCEAFHEAIMLLMPLGRILSKQFSIISNVKTSVDTTVMLAEELQQVNAGKKKIQDIDEAEKPEKAYVLFMAGEIITSFQI